jgi:hypothetical protein
VKWEVESSRLRTLTEECWDADGVLYHLRDRDTHCSPAGKVLGTLRGEGRLDLDQTFLQPVRLLIRLKLKGESARRPIVSLCGQNGKAPQTERLDRMDFQWGVGLAAATSRSVYTRVAEIEVTGLEKHDRVSVCVIDFSAEDVTLFLPLWAGIPDSHRALNIVNQTLFAADRFGGSFGIPVCEVVPVPARGEVVPVPARGEVVPVPARGATSPNPESAPLCQAVHLPWNALIGAGLLGYGLRSEAAQLTTRLMSAVIQNLKQQHAFARAYHVQSGAGIGERNPVQGLAPLGLFLDTLGVRIESPKRVVLSGKNPFPWSITVKYRGLTITRHADQTLVVFPNGQMVTLDDPTDAVVSTE